MKSNKGQPQQPQTAGTKSQQQPQISGKKSQQHPQQQRRRKRNKKHFRQSVNDPMKIIEAVLAKTSFKVPNLSQIVDEKFYGAPDYSAQVGKLLKNIKYESTVGLTTDNCIEEEMSVLPIGFNGRIELPIRAITSLSCIKEAADKKKGPKKKPNVDTDKTRENSTIKDETSIKSNETHQNEPREPGPSRKRRNRKRNKKSKADADKTKENTISNATLETNGIHQSKPKEPGPARQ